MLRILGQNEYGIYNTVSSIIAYLVLLSLGFGASYIKFYSNYKSKGGKEEIKRLNGLYLLVFLVIGLISLVLGLFLSNNAQWFFNDTYSDDNISTARVLMVFLTINLSLSFPSSLFVSYITSQEKFIFQKLLNIFKTVLSPLACVLVLCLGFRSIGMVIVTTSIAIIVDLVNILYCIFKLRMGFSFKKPNFFLLKDIFFFSLFIAINQLVDQLNLQADKVILGKIVGGVSVAVYSVGSTINAMFTNLSVAISNVFSPTINGIVSENKPDTNKKLNALFIKVGRVQWFLLALILSGFVFFGKFFISKWAGEGYENSYYVALLLMAPMSLVLIQSIGIEIQRAKNKHKVRSIVYLCMAIINVLISIRFATMWGEIGSVLGTTISIVLCSVIFMNIYYYKRLQIDVISFWKSILSTLPSMILPACFGIIFMLFYKYNSLFDFSKFVIIYTIIYCLSVFTLGFKKDERELIIVPIKRIIRK